MKRKPWHYALRAAGLAAAAVFASMLFEYVAVEPVLAAQRLEPKMPLQSDMPVSAAPRIPSVSRSTKPEIDPESWELTLVNKWNPLAEGFTVQTAEVERGYRFDARAADRLTAMLDACRAAGLKPLLCSAYRSQDYQVSLFERQILKQQGLGLAGEDAVAAAGEVVAVPGTSEHQLGLAADISSMEYQFLDEGQEHTAEYQWLRGHCAEYGFILRYPPEKTEYTGVIYEPWHFRYVGEDAAAYITEQGLTLEEFLQK